MSTQNRELDVYQVVFTIVHSWRHGDTPKSIQNCWSHIGILYVLATNQALHEAHEKEVQTSPHFWSNLVW